MASTRTPASADAASQNSAIAGLDSLELGDLTKSREPARIARKVWSATWPKLLAIGLVLGAWQLFYLSNFHGDTDSGLVNGPGAGLANLWDQAQHVQLWQAIGNTVRTAVIGYLLAMLIGSILGAVVSRIPPLRAATGSIISGLQTMPSIAWFPFAIILFGTTQSAILFVMVLGAAPSIANGLITGVDYTPPLLLRAGRTMGLRGISLYRHLILPASLPAYLAGLKQGWAFAWRSLMAGQLLVIIVGNLSLGVLLNNAQDNQDLTGAISIMIVILVIGIVVDAIFSKTDLVVRRRRGLLTEAQST
ncbi:MAG TPA: ABC transporter permease subunit [Streptosporangiaceae bacterium]|jgi:NitT/TauT family transport system permease protein|nr:ABC transporter permease subunit [Streptosporangiaceae bacterium]